MFTISTATVVLAFVLLAVAAVAAVSAIGAISYAIAGTRKDRLARHESIRSYYGRVAFSH
ncbi:hypothetical protein GCM10009795_040520 [Nocardioides hankookensis]|uniref:Secreted protein n=1 Tax=Nocardioides hankookensis TaxID=443157 RepID=A0ABW1LQC9_9ACTN